METLVGYKYKFLTSQYQLLFNTPQGVSFLIHNRISLQHEFNDLLRIYNKRELDPKTEQWFFEVCLMLEKYHEKNEIMSRPYKIQALTIKKEQLKRQQHQGKLEIVHQKKSLSILSQEIKELDAKSKNCSNNLTLAAAREQVGFGNMWRLNSRFAMITVGASLQNNYLMQLLAFLGQQQVDTTILVAPINTYNALSVGFFGLRFLINVIDIVQNLVNASTEEKQLSLLYRLYVELDKHEYQLGNDIVWGVINFFTNFPRYLHISAPVTNYVMGAFLVFDMVWMGRLLYKESARFAVQREDNAWLVQKLMNESDPSIYKGVITDIDSQTKELGYRQENLTWNLLFYVGAGLLLLSGFSAAILLSPPAFVPLCFLVCNIGIAMYFSGELAGAVMEKRKILNDTIKDKKTEKEIKGAQGIFDTALQNLGASMLEFTFVPLIILGVFTVSWPAAVALTALYLADKIGNVKSVREHLPALPTFFDAKGGNAGNEERFSSLGTASVVASNEK